tara:strand:- start:252 stop:419 length:168 start_codon:yes stop_codon:yes gene_type:complete
MVFGIDTSLWNRVTYPEKKDVVGIVLNAGIVVVASGCFAIAATWPISKLVELFAV